MEIGLGILALGFVVWLLMSKATRKSFGASAQGTAHLIEESIMYSRVEAFNNAKEELGDIKAQLAELEALRGGN